ncbi:MAG: AzlC family ABC transporter permease [Methanobrevibacter sp.]
MTFGYIPMGIGYAALSIKAGVSPLQTVAMSIFVYAGAGQIIAVSMIGQGATLIAIILTNFVVNLRYFVMNLCVYNKVTENSLLTNILSAHLTVDESFAIFSLMEESSIWIYIGIALIAYLSWIFGAAIGVMLLNFLPVIVTNSFNISLYALFVAILIPAIKHDKKLGILVVFTGVLNIILKAFVSNWSLILSTIVAAAIGVYYIDDETVMGSSCNDNEDDKTRSY